MPDVTVKIEPSHRELAAVSRNHPDDEFWIRDSHVSEDGMQVLYEVRTTNADSVIQSFEDVTDLDSFEIVYMGEEMILVRCVIDEPAPFRAARASGNLARSPPILRNGWLVVTFTTSDEGLSRFKRELEATETTYHVLSITPSSSPARLLTERQEEVITAAINRGYYETPRECSVTELAEFLGVTKGSLSRVLHRAEGRIIKKFVTAPTHE